ncbi:hypothetical protein M1L60_26160 [Actinoplanes sp. TRM 88003]|uniref:Secreted protein n=1 Tax=Paractinoplanes aksuensis TaxID=2939490 RepID=A0ABT1DVU3_9ACTN|nr:hypothetical protein [Actinoplanes aksuensis]MCO8274090.1 hypothetical protein [Actinoplanes aksuensis]
MRKTAVRLSVGLAAVAAFGTVAATPAAAAPADVQSGLSFYVYNRQSPTFVANFPQPDSSCQAVPARADLLVGWSGLTNVLAYRSADCSDRPASLGTLRSIRPGEFQSFRTE